MPPAPRAPTLMASSSRPRQRPRYGAGRPSAATSDDELLRRMLSAVLQEVLWRLRVYTPRDKFFRETRAFGETCHGCVLAEVQQYVDGVALAAVEDLLRVGQVDLVLHVTDRDGKDLARFATTLAWSSGDAGNDSITGFRPVGEDGVRQVFRRLLAALQGRIPTDFRGPITANGFEIDVVAMRVGPVPDGFVEKVDGGGGDSDGGNIGSSRSINSFVHVPMPTQSVRSLSMSCGLELQDGVIV